MKIATLAVTIPLLGGCLHAPPNYPGAGGANIDPATYVNTLCPDISGRYEGRGVLVDGDATAQQTAPAWRLDNVFPFSDSLQAAEVIGAAGYRVPAYGDVNWSERKARVHLVFDDGRKKEYESSFLDKGRFICTGASGKIVWGGGGEESRSEFGPNKLDYVKAIYLNENRDLIMEKEMQVHMSLRLGNIPAGTARYFSKYQFKRLR
ncbi:hypothetical protein E7Z57_21660 (plasmid) [Ralstonia pseudosolanacearum]|uniref:Lipoprotein n=1 Tax=Ralstonia solanacearum TaxID=305 RepID=A0AA92EHL2_RALSL|nr:hypothetical protein E7Z57_21660 [Ralstonia pseudosolanacearum]